MERLLNKKIYLCGSITNNENYINEFFGAELKVKKLYGEKVLNPAKLPVGLEYADYMDICTAMVRVADALVVVNDIENSAGAKAELALANSLKKPIFNYTFGWGEIWKI